MGLIWSVEVIKGTKTFMQMAKVFKVSIEQVMEHIEQHLDRKDILELAKEGETLAGRMERIIKVLECELDLLTTARTMDYTRIKSLANIVRELRCSLMDYAELIGKIQRGQVIVQIQQVENKIAVLTQLVLENCCDECKNKILQAIEGMI